MDVFNVNLCNKEYDPVCITLHDDFFAIKMIHAKPHDRESLVTVEMVSASRQDLMVE